MIDKSEYAKWLTFEIDYHGKYHHHKETMAWVATALYLPGIFVLGYKVGQNCECLAWKVVITVLVLVVAYLVFCFVKMQFDMRWYAADVVAILMQRLAKLNSGEEPPPQSEWAIEKEDKDGWTKHWPKFMKCEIRESKAERNRQKACKALRKFCWWWHKDKGEVDDRWKTELPSYVAIVIATIIAILLIWCPLS